MSSDLPTDQSDSPEVSEVRGLSPADRGITKAEPVEVPDSEELPDGEWAELERATDPAAEAASGEVHNRATQIDTTVVDSIRTADDQTVDEGPPAVEGKVREATTTDEESTGLADGVGDAAVEPDEEIVTEDDSSEDSVADAADDQALSPISMPLPRVIAVANQKGGVGKTTTTVNIAACLAEQGYRTLLVDLDPQANASTGLGLEPRELEHSVYHVMLHGEDADSCIEPTEVKNLFILPSSLDLAGAEIELVAVMSREHRLRLAIESVLDDYDYVLIDCPPSLGLLTINALSAAREVLVPIQCEYYALEGLGQLMRNVDLVKANLNPGLQISHIVLVMFDPRTKLAGQVVDEVRGHFGATVCANVIPRTVRLSEAPSFGQPITTFDTASRGAAAYRAVTQEVLGGQA